MTEVAGEEYSVPRQNGARDKTIPHPDPLPCLFQAASNRGGSVGRFRVQRQGDQGVQKVANQALCPDGPRAREQLEAEYEQLSKRLTELQGSLPPEEEAHGWVWLFVRQ